MRSPQSFLLYRFARWERAGRCCMEGVSPPKARYPAASPHRPVWAPCGDVIRNMHTPYGQLAIFTEIKQSVLKHGRQKP